MKALSRYPTKTLFPIYQQIADRFEQAFKKKYCLRTLSTEKRGEFEYALWRQYYFLGGPEAPLFRLGLEVCATDAGYYELQLYAQAEDYIDKFKASASTLLVSEKFYPQEKSLTPCFEDAKHIALDFCSCEKLLGFIKKQPYLAWYRDVHFCNFNLTYIHPGEAKRAYLLSQAHLVDTRTKAKREVYEVVQYLANLLHKKGEIFYLEARKNCSPCVEIQVEDPTLENDSGKDGWWSSPDYISEAELAHIRQMIHDIRDGNEHVYHESHIDAHHFEKVWLRKKIARPTLPWVKENSVGYFTPGGEPCFKCPTCGQGEHIAGVENGYKFTCPDCGQTCFYLQDEV